MVLLDPHQVVTGWTALALLWSALARIPDHVAPGDLAALAFPVVWSWIAIFQLSNFMGWRRCLRPLPQRDHPLDPRCTLWRYRPYTGSAAATGLAVTFFLWGLHHLDYPILRARGAWNPWGYYIDLVVLAIGAGVTAPKPTGPPPPNPCRSILG